MNLDHDNVALTFSKLMFQGRTRAALRLLDKSASKGLRSLNSVSTRGKTVRAILKEKHPKSREPSPDVLLREVDGCEPGAHPIIFESLDADCIRKAGLKVERGAGPSGLDADAWRRLCTSFKSASNDLCNAIGFLQSVCVLKT